jgi:hypothetical protein
MCRVRCDFLALADLRQQFEEWVLDEWDNRPIDDDGRGLIAGWAPFIARMHGRGGQDAQ